jgi:hypothetical protein
MCCRPPPACASIESNNNITRRVLLSKVLALSHLFRYLVVYLYIYIYTLWGHDRNGGLGWKGIVAGGAVGWFLGGKYHANKVAKKLSAKHKQDQKVLYQQYYNDVYALQQQNSELILALEKQYGRVGSSGSGSSATTTTARRKA